jgi:hypothetical protein
MRHTGADTQRTVAGSNSMQPLDPFHIDQNLRIEQAVAKKQQQLRPARIDFCLLAGIRKRAGCFGYGCGLY